jgi:hypothetical protein
MEPAASGRAQESILAEALRRPDLTSVPTFQGDASEVETIAACPPSGSYPDA